MSSLQCLDLEVTRAPFTHPFEPLMVSPIQRISLHAFLDPCRPDSLDALRLTPTRESSLRISSRVARCGSAEVAEDEFERVCTSRSASVIILSFRISETLPTSDATLSETSSHEASVGALVGLMFILAFRDMIASRSSSIFLRTCCLNCSSSVHNAMLPEISFSLSSSSSPNGLWGPSNLLLLRDGAFALSGRRVSITVLSLSRGSCSHAAFLFRSSTSMGRKGVPSDCTSMGLVPPRRPST